jgi:polyhydroxyalkanoate synthesis regulator phasin
MITSARSSISRQSGVALGIVMWFLAGMSLLVSGIVYQVRVDTRMAQLHLARATAVSAGDGAILLMLADLVSLNPREFSQQGLLSQKFIVGVHEVSVTLVPVAGLVNLNQSSAKTLTQLLVAQGHVTAGEAKTLADNVVKWRGDSGLRISKRQSGQLQSVEDLLQVDGFTRTVWDGIRNSVAATAGSGGESDLASALASLRAAAMNGGGSGPREGVPGQGRSTRGKKPAGHQRLDGSFRVDATVQYGGRTWLRRKWVNLSGTGSDSLPWKITRVEAPRVMPGD